ARWVLGPRSPRQRLEHHRQLPPCCIEGSGQPNHADRGPCTAGFARQNTFCARITIRRMSAGSGGSRDCRRFPSRRLWATTDDLPSRPSLPVDCSQEKNCQPQLPLPVSMRTFLAPWRNSSPTAHSLQELIRAQATKEVRQVSHMCHRHSDDYFQRTG